VFPLANNAGPLRPHPKGETSIIKIWNFEKIINPANYMDGLEPPSHPEICIKYDDDKCANVQNLDLLRPLLVNERRGVVLVGEGNYTFSIAFAVVRKSWEGFTSTRYDSIDPVECSKPQFTEAKLTSIEFCINSGRWFGVDTSTILENIAHVVNLQPPPEENWLFGIDATNIPDSLNVCGKVVWFQCPWVKIGTPGSPAKLIASFLEHMGMKQSHNDYLLVGIATFFPYVKQYRLQDILGENLSGPTDKSGKYDFLGVDTALIRSILQHGYRHQACDANVDIHTQLLNNHITLIFQRNATQ
jgi:hypothetical protein